jgi:biopolymer transport protein ExbB/TolQ
MTRLVNLILPIGNRPERTQRNESLVGNRSLDPVRFFLIARPISLDILAKAANGCRSRDLFQDRRMISFSLRRNPGGATAFLIGMGMSGLYYLFVFLPFMRDSVLHAYTTHHATEYAIVLLFFWATAEHLICFLNGTKEREAVRRFTLPTRYGLEETRRSGALLESLKHNNGAFTGSMMYQRIQSALRFIHEGQSVSGFREYLESLEVRDANQIFERYGFSRFVTTILPILGLIGTVVHFGAALTGLSMEGLTEKLPQMLSSMGTAFNTTFTAMTCMVVTFLIRFLIERRDHELLRKIDAYVEDHLLHRFQGADGPMKHLTDALSASTSTLLSSLLSFEGKLVDEWNNRLDAMQRRSDELNQRQELNLVHFLKMVERQQESHVDEVKQWNNELVVAQKMTNEIASSLIADGQLLKLQDRLAENLVLLQQSQRLEDAMQELTGAIHLFTSRQNSVLPKRTAA